MSIRHIAAVVVRTSTWISAITLRWIAMKTMSSHLALQKKDFTAGTKRSVGLEFLPANSRPIDPMWSGSYSTTLTRDFARLLIQGIQSLMFRKYAASSDTRLDTKSP